MKINQKLIIKYLIGLILFLIFQTTIESWLIELFKDVNTRLTSFKIGFLLICCLSVFFIGFSFWQKYFLNTKFAKIIGFLLLVYSCSRILDSDEWSLSNQVQFKVFDLFLLFGICYLVVFWYQNKYSRDSGKKLAVFSDEDFEKEDKVQFLIDNPHNGKIDNEHIVNKLINRLTGFYPEHSFTIGINAPWGYGKTTFLKRFEEKYKYKNQEAIIFWYRIWKNHGSATIIDNFFKELSKELSCFSGEISSEIDKYVKAILRLAPSDLGKILEVGTNIFEENETLEGYYKTINREISKIDRQVIVLLDDLDRLESDEILSSFKIIRTLSDFDNVIFIAGYDRSYIERELTKDKEKYLNKIFQVELTLASFNERSIREMLVKSIRECFPVDDKSSNNLSVFQSFYLLFNTKSQVEVFDMDLFLENENLANEEFYDLGYKDFIVTYRDVKRFINEFNFKVNFLKDQKDVIMKEYVLLHLMLFKYRELENIFFTEPEKYMSRYIIDEVNKKLKTSMGTYDDLYVYDELAKVKVENRIKTDSKYSENDIAIINAVFLELFGKKQISYYLKYQNTISKIYHLNTYLRSGNVGANYTLSDFKDAFKNNSVTDLISEIKQLKEPVVTRVLSELKRFIFSRTVNDRIDFVKTLSYFNSILTGYSFEENKNVTNLIDKSFELYYGDDKKGFIEDMKKVLESDFRRMYVDYLLSDIVINLKRKERFDLYNESNSLEYEFKSLTIQELKRVLLFKLEYVIKNSTVISDVVNAYHLFTEKIVSDHQIIRSSEANILLREVIKNKFLDYFLTDYFDFIEEPKGSGFPQDYKTFRPNDFLAQIFSKTDTLEELIANPESLELYNKFKNEGWDNYIAFMEEQTLNAYTDGYEQGRLDKIKKMLLVFKENGYKPLSFKQYNEIWNLNK